jgi:hypothetical protein
MSIIKPVWFRGAEIRAENAKDRGSNVVAFPTKPDPAAAERELNELRRARRPAEIRERLDELDAQSLKLMAEHIDLLRELNDLEGGVNV